MTDRQTTVYFYQSSHLFYSGQKSSPFSLHLHCLHKKTTLNRSSYLLCLVLYGILVKEAVDTCIVEDCGSWAGW